MGETKSYKLLVENLVTLDYLEDQDIDIISYKNRFFLLEEDWGGSGEGRVTNFCGDSDEV